MARPYLTAEMRRLVIARAEARCEYCQSPADYATQSFDVDHIIPVSRNGPSSVDNLTYACSGCNRHKFNRLTGIDPIEGSEVSLFHPRQMVWQEHFGWNENYTLLIGLTSIGRATVDALQLNRDGVVNLRRLLRLVDKHPPFFTTAP
ncbi:MAG: HNH endonuclease signature motif containing protein [Caldilineaceae bacterium]